MRFCLLVLLCLAETPLPSGPVYPLYTLETLVDRADNIMIGEVVDVTEKMEHLKLDGVTSPFLVVTAHFKNIEILRGDPQKTSIRQYSSFANIWRKGEKLLVFSNKPTELGFEPVLGAGIMTIKESDAHGYIVYKGKMQQSMPLQAIREVIKASNR